MSEFPVAVAAKARRGSPGLAGGRIAVMAARSPWLYQRPGTAPRL